MSKVLEDVDPEAVTVTKLRRDLRRWKMSVMTVFNVSEAHGH